MTDKDLKLANDLKEEIDKLKDFISIAESIWRGKIIKQDTQFIFKTIPYGTYKSAEFELNTDMKNKVLDILKSHLEDLKNQLELL